THGRLTINGRVVNDLAPRDRDVALVFQSYALYPHLTVEGNIGFGLRVRGATRAEIARKVRETAKLLELDPYLNRKPSQLSGGQRQRVAMGRALARPDARRDRVDAENDWDHDRLCHARSNRGDDDGRQDRFDERRRSAAARIAADPLRRAGESVCRGLHRRAGDELPDGGAGRGRSRRGGALWKKLHCFFARGADQAASDQVVCGTLRRAGHTPRGV